MAIPPVSESIPLQTCIQSAKLIKRKLKHILQQESVNSADEHR